MLLQMHDYSPEAKVFWWTTALLGLVVLSIALATIAGFERGAILQIVLGATFAAVTGIFPVRIPGAKTSIAGAEIFVFLLLLLYGPAAAAFAAAAEAAVGSWRTSDRWTSRLGSPAMAALAMYGCGTAFTFALHALQSGGDTGLGIVFGMLLLLAFAYCATSTLLMASLITLKRGERVRPLQLLRSHGWLGLVYAASASIACLLFVSFDRFGAGVLLFAAPIIGMFLSTLHFYFQKIEATERAQCEQIAAAEREARDTARHFGELQNSDNRFHSAFTHAAIGMVLVSTDRRILQANQALCSLLEKSEVELIGTELTEIVHPEDVNVLRTNLATLLDGMGTGFTVELRCRHSQGLAVWVLLDGSFFNAGEAEARCLIIQVQDVTARRTAESRLQHIARHDDLTNIPNRGHFLEQLGRAIATRKQQPQHRFAVLFLDFDRFKVINDSLGHGAGDELLVTLARRIQSLLRGPDVVARLGGDEFAILVENLHSDQDVIDLAERLQRALRQPIRLGTAEVSTSVSIGITTSAFSYDGPEDVMRDADIAMYRAKAQGKARYALFDSALHAEVSSQMWLEGELRRALDEEQLELAYQPILDLRTRRVVGVEALCRWSHPARGAIAPDLFIRVAEETGLIVPLGNWVLDKACRQLRVWQRTVPGFADITLNVNVSGVQLSQPGFAIHAQRVIAESGICPADVTLEVTESVLMEKLSGALPNLLSLRDAGVQISIDDFGTGYSSLSALQDLPIGEIKVDRSFLRRMSGGGNGEEVVRAIVAMGAALGKRVIAEGIETEAQLDTLVELDCAKGQGFLLAHPMPHGDFELMMKELRAVRCATS
jgi:diguanylate cyclase (GGDEF)-like protein/PAS domain S-box-containing protein